MASNTSSERKGFTITWIIENIKYSTQNDGEILTSPSFIVDTMRETKWSLFLYPCFHKGTLEDGFHLGLRRMPDCKGPSTIKIDCECALLTADGCVDGPYNVTQREVSKNDEVLLPRFKKTYGISAGEYSFITNSNLTFRCKMWKCFGEINNDGFCTARTHIGVEKKSSIWSIRNFSTLEEGDELTYRIRSTLNDKSIATLKFSVTGDDQTLQVSFISSDSKDYSRSSFPIKISVLESNGDAVTCGEAKVLFVKESLEKESKFLLSLTKKEVMRKKIQYLRNDVLSLLYESNFSYGLIYEAIENINYGGIPPQTANACLPDLKLAEITATANPNAPSVLKKDIELMLHENGHASE
ncbi:speckle-type POZ protein B [Caerostris darwini]|uniref:Speckle-type POZ protein B n=1 Tax=Caerostris darwini TaxID=1538125 RepID=A0AAV4W4D2_9ARAC|nr:speckle-type POZ protein B [Caerostris darwini]